MTCDRHSHRSASFKMVTVRQQRRALIESIMEKKTASTRRRHQLSVLFICLINVVLCAHFAVGLSIANHRHSRISRPSFDSPLLLSAAKSDDNDKASFQHFFVRKAMFVDMGEAARILTDGFFKDKTNFITFQVERLNTYLSLESGFPKDHEQHEMFVACHSNSGKVLGFCEIDGRPLCELMTPTPYMCNLAIDTQWRQKGLARALVKACEDQAREWNSDAVSLKVRESNKVAIEMYKSFGYEGKGFQDDTMTNQRVLLMQKTIPKKEETTVAVMEQQVVNVTAQ